MRKANLEPPQLDFLTMEKLLIQSIFRQDPRTSQLLLKFNVLGAAIAGGTGCFPDNQTEGFHGWTQIIHVALHGLFIKKSLP